MLDYGLIQKTIEGFAETEPWYVPFMSNISALLYEEMEDYNLSNEEPVSLRKGENWNLGDSPAIAALLECDWRGNFHMERAPRIRDDMRYEPDPEGKWIRVYDYVDVRMLMEDLFAKLSLCCRNF